MRAPKTLLLLVLCALAACGVGQREKTIKTTLAATNAVRDDFIAIDGRAQMVIVETATSREEGISRLALYRSKRDAVVQGFATAYRAIAIAATASDDPSVASMITAAKQLHALVEQLRKDFL